MNRILVLTISLATVMTGCANLDDAHYIDVKELATEQSVFTIEESGSTIILPVFSNGSVSATFMDNSSDWASIDKTAMSGDDTLHLSFAENTGLRRMTKLLLSLNDGQKNDTLYFKQLGTDPVLNCESPFASIDGRSENAVDYVLQTNLDAKQIKSDVEYISGAKNWISSVALAGETATVSTRPTGVDQISRARVILTYIDSWEELMTATLFVTASDRNGRFGTEISWDEAKSYAGMGTVSEEVFIKGVIISDCNSLNMALNPSVAYNKVDVTESSKSAYIQKEDGSAGLCLKFETPDHNVLTKGTLISLSLYGSKIEKAENPERYTIRGLKADNVVESSPGTIVEKKKTISQLQDSDIYTWVKLQDTEFYCKYGSYANVNENYTLSSSVNAMCSSANKDRLDGWATMLVDKEGAAIYAPVNMLCQWRRSIDPSVTTLVPQGNGITEGIIVSENNYRYGNMGRYQIRVLDQTGFCQPVDGESAYIEHVRYNGQPYSYRFGQYSAINLKYAAPTGLENRMKNTIIPSDDISQSKQIPNAELKCQNWAAAAALTDTNYPMASYEAYCSPICSNTNVGKAGAASTDNSTGHPRALMLTHEIKGWYEWTDNKVSGYRGIVIDMNTESIEGNVMTFAFAFAAGKTSALTAVNFPAHWCVECSIDGGETYTLCKNAITGGDYVHLRTHPWADATIGGAQYLTSSGCGLGATEHSFCLPSDAFGKNQVLIKIRPYDDVMSVLPLTWNGDVENGKVAYNTKADTYISFEYISVRYR